MPTLGEVLVVATIAGCTTGLGALPTLVTDRVSHRVYDGALGLAAGIMVGAAVFALVVPGLELGSPGEVVTGVLLGGAFLLVTNAILPHLHLHFRNQQLEGTPLERAALREGIPRDGATEEGATLGEGIVLEERDQEERLVESDLEEESEDANADDLRRALLVGSAVTIHNVPEGLAVGIAFGSGEAGLGIAIATAIAIQNVPDGFAMAVPATRAGVSRTKTVGYTTLSGGVPEPIAAALGFSLVVFVTGLFPLAAGFAAGAMIAVVFRELVPSSHGHGYADTATATFVLGFSIMLVVDTVLAV